MKQCPPLQVGIVCWFLSDTAGTWVPSWLEEVACLEHNAWKIIMMIKTKQCQFDGKDETKQ